MRISMSRSALLSARLGLAGLFAIAACGGAQKPATPSEDAAAPAEGKKNEPKRDISSEARDDFASAADAFAAADKKGRWSDGQCRQMADRFSAVARQHKELVEAQYMVGLSYHRCNLLDEAEREYQKAKGHSQSLSNLGEIYFRAGKVDAAKQQWESALKANDKLVAAHNNLASLLIEQLRETKPGKGWDAIEADARRHLSSALAVDASSIKAYTLYGLLYMEGRERNKNRLDLAKLLLDEGEKRDSKYAPLKNARGIYFLYRNNLSEALQQFLAAVELDPGFIEARLNVGLTTVGFRKYDTAKDQFSKVIELDGKNYNAYIGLGIALRGLGDMEGAETRTRRPRTSLRSAARRTSISVCSTKTSVRARRATFAHPRRRIAPHEIIFASSSPRTAIRQMKMRPRATSATVTN
ncbi:MAG: tetratricopeptide repeat protein [Myxococcales bacterium]|nr:tetratricopeptide repeat protein [Myxococcales bacterium]